MSTDLYVCELVPESLPQVIPVHGWDEERATLEDDVVDGTDDAGRARAEQLQQLQERERMNE